MKKVYKLLILLILPILILCGVAVPTYCADTQHFPASNVYSITPFQSINGKQNFYNYSNLQDVYYTNFKLNDLISNDYFCSFYDGSSQSYNGLNIGINIIPIDVWEVRCFDTPIGYYSGSISLKLSETKTVCNMFTNLTYHSYDNVKINPLNYGLGGIAFDIIPYSVLSYMTNIQSAGLNPNNAYFAITFDIVTNNQYFYNKYFGLVFNFKPFINGAISENGYLSNVKHSIFYSFYLNKNYGTYGKSDMFYQDFVKSQNEWFVVLENNYSFDNDYVISFSSALLFDGTIVVNPSGVNLSSSTFQYNIFLNYNYTNDNYIYLYSNTTNNEGLYSSTIIPNGSNDFYKSCEWWDIPTHLYNFLIYVIFDAPIISDFTRLAYVIIQFIVSVFEWIIALFTGISSSFFIAIFVGFIVLMFLLKIIFKG